MPMLINADELIKQINEKIESRKLKQSVEPEDRVTNAAVIRSYYIIIEMVEELIGG